MTQTITTSLERILKSLNHEEPDRVPLVMAPFLHAAREVGLSLTEYFKSAENLVEGQLRLREKYGLDAVSGFAYTAAEAEAWGTTIKFSDDGPPNSNEPAIQTPEDIMKRDVPCIEDCPPLMMSLEATRMLRAKTQDEALLLGVVIAPFSLPVMQMGYSRYLDTIFEYPKHFERLMALNEDFCVAWANAQVEAGAMAVAFYDPLFSPLNFPRDMVKKTAFPLAKRTIARIQAPVVYHFASAPCLPVADLLLESGAAAVSGCPNESLADAKQAFGGKMTILGNLNGVAMRRWSREEAEQQVKDAIAKAAPGGGFLMTDSHGEIPFSVPEEIIHTICDSCRKWGKYPLDWLGDHG
ncbi:MAG: uroporphyrinogen decarboxylase family protein [Candidatus Sumerlaeia bacterium]